jgi:hypothetical protein
MGALNYEFKINPLDRKQPEEKDIAGKPIHQIHNAGKGKFPVIFYFLKSNKKNLYFLRKNPDRLKPGLPPGPGWASGQESFAGHSGSKKFK